MEVKVLRSQTTNKSISHVARGAGIWVIWKVARQGFTVLHLGHTASFQLLLTKQNANLSHVNQTSLGSCEYHSRYVVAREPLDQSVRYTQLQDLTSRLI
jgi:hypothetical protein